MNQKHQGQIFLNIHVGLKIKGKGLENRRKFLWLWIIMFGKKQATLDKSEV